MSRRDERDAVAKQTSGFDALIDALKQSGVNMDGRFDADQEAPAGGPGNGAGGGSKPPHVDVQMQFGDYMAAWGRKAIIILAIVIVLVGLAAYWWFHPPINIHSTDTWMFVTIFILLPAFLVLGSKSRAYRTGTDKVEPNQAKAKAFKWATLVPVVVVAFALLGAVASLSLFPGNAEKYATVLETSTDDFAKDIQEVNYSEIPVIDRDSAVLLGNREMGSIPEYVSQFEISPLYSQINYQGAPVRVSPLGYADLFKWFTNREAGIPGYALVNMTTQDAQIVRLDDNPIHYSESEPLVRNIDRHVQLSYPFYMFDQKSFEIDDEGHAWWICPVQSRTIGLFGGTTIERVVMVDATTGECTDLAIEDVPQWVDHAYPTELLLEQYNWSGKYKDGWLNSWLGQSGVVQTTPGTDGNLGYNYIAKDDDVWVYTGVTSATADNSIVGFVLEPAHGRTAFTGGGRDGRNRLCSRPRARCRTCAGSGNVPAAHQRGRPADVLHGPQGQRGLVKQFAMLDIQRYQNVAVGNTVEETQKSYLALLATNGVVSGNVESVDALEAKGVISHIATAVIDGNTHFYLKLEGEDAVYDFALPSMLEIVGYKEGDSIAFTYVEGSPLNVADTIEGSSASGGAAAADQAADEADATADAQGNAA